MGDWPTTPCLPSAPCVTISTNRRPPGLDRLAPAGRKASNVCPRAKLPRICAPLCGPYQKVAVNWLTFLRSVGLGGILAGDMGLGDHRGYVPVEKKFLVVRQQVCCPTGRPNSRAFAPQVRVSVYHGPTRKLARRGRHSHTDAILRLDGRRSWLQSTSTWWFSTRAQAIKTPTVRWPARPMRFPPIPHSP